MAALPSSEHEFHGIPPSSPNHPSALPPTPYPPAHDRSPYLDPTSSSNPPPHTFSYILSTTTHADKVYAADLRAAKRTFERRQRIQTLLLQAVGVCIATTAIILTGIQWKDTRTAKAQGDAQVAWQRQWEVFKYCSDVELQYRSLSTSWDSVASESIVLNDSSLKTFVKQQSLQQELAMAAFQVSRRGLDLDTCLSDNITVFPYEPFPNTLASFASFLYFPPFSLSLNFTMFQWIWLIFYVAVGLVWAAAVLFLMAWQDPEDIVRAERKAAEARRRQTVRDAEERRRKEERRRMTTVRMRNVPREVYDVGVDIVRRLGI